MFFYAAMRHVHSDLLGLQITRGNQCSVVFKANHRYISFFPLNPSPQGHCVHFFQMQLVIGNGSACRYRRKILVKLHMPSSVCDLAMI